MWAAGGVPDEVTRFVAESPMADFTCNACRYCGGNLSDSLSEENDEWFAYHEPGCVWVLARSWVKSQP